MPLSPAPILYTKTSLSNSKLKNGQKKCLSRKKRIFANKVPPHWKLIIILQSTQ